MRAVYDASGRRTPDKGEDRACTLVQVGRTSRVMPLAGSCQLDERALLLLAADQGMVIVVASGRWSEAVVWRTAYNAGTRSGLVQK